MSSSVLKRKMSNVSVTRPVREGTKTEDDLQRTVPLGRRREEDSAPVFCSNAVHTNKYSVITFLPKNLYEQFHRVANFYFVLVVVLNFVLDVFGKEIGVIPLTFVLGCTAAKDIYEDWRRRQSDKDVNNRVCCRIELGGEEKYIRWTDVRVGDFLRIGANESVPADVLNVCSSNGSLCFVETTNIDGETNLKQRACVIPDTGADIPSCPSGVSAASCPHTGERGETSPLTESVLSNGGVGTPPSGCRIPCSMRCDNLSGVICSTPPRKELTDIHGTLEVTAGSFSTGATPLHFDHTNVLLRGCVVRNVEWVLGVALFTGKETKAVLNSGRHQPKRSKLEKQMNREFILLTMTCMLMCFVVGVGKGLWERDVAVDGPMREYFPMDPALDGFMAFWRSIVVFQVMIPIAMYVMLEAIKLVLCKLIEQDLQLYHPEFDMPAAVHAFNIPENLGQVGHIFSDKTGTLTDNIMRLQEVYSVATDSTYRVEDGKKHVASNFSLCHNAAGPSSTSTSSTSATTSSASPTNTNGGAGVLTGRNSNGSRAPQTELHYLFLALAVCNTVAPTQKQCIPPSATMPEAAMLPTASTPRVRNSLPITTKPLPSSDPTSAPFGTTTAGGSSTGLLHPNPTSGALSDITLRNVQSNGAADEVLSVGVLSNPCSPSLTAKLPILANIPMEPLDPMSPVSVSEPSTPANPSVTVTKTSSSKAIRGLGSTLGRNQNNSNSNLNAVVTTSRSNSNLAATVLSPLKSPKLRALGFGFGGGNDDKDETLSVRSVQQLPAPEYQFESPDELALVLGVREFGYTLLSRVARPSEGTEMLVIEQQGTNGSVLTMQMVAQLPFDHVRKCMTVILEYRSSAHSVPEYLAVSKGADTAICKRLTAVHRSQYESVMYQRTADFSCRGLRILWFAYRTLSAAMVKETVELIKACKVSPLERERLMQKAADSVEQELIPLGVTAIEDKLQDGVPEAIQALRYAGIRVWLLTGDMQQTALNIALSIKLITPNMTQLIITASSEAEAIAEINTLSQTMTNPVRTALIISGASLAVCLQEEVVDLFYKLVHQLAVVLCCRVSPLQKAEVVALIKHNSPGLVTMAVGDGANDVAMLKRAHVGIGISGREGHQAVMASDFAIGRFRFLVPLLLVHGHWCYHRLSRIAIYIMYKNFLFCMLLFLFHFYTGFSDTTTMDEVALMLFNIIYTTLPPLIIGILDQDATRDMLVYNPQLYAYGRKDQLYNKRTIGLYTADVFWQAAAIFYVPYFAFVDQDEHLWGVGMVHLFAGVFVVNFQLLMDSFYVTWHFLVAILVSVGSAFLLQYLTDLDEQKSYYDSFNMELSTVAFWLCFIMATTVASLPRFIVLFIQTNTLPTMADSVRSEFQAGKLGRVVPIADPASSVFGGGPVSGEVACCAAPS